jgi:hypothetical protein
VWNYWLGGKDNCEIDRLAPNDFGTPVPVDEFGAVGRKP